MAIQFVPGQVTVSDPNPGGPTALSNIKEKMIKVVKLSGANFTTTNTDTLVAVLPADATIVNMHYTVTTQLAGNGITAATISVGSASGGTQFVNASTLAFGTAGASADFPVLTGVFQNYNIPFGSDIRIFVRGTATTGNPTSGEAYLMIEYVR